MSLASMTAVAAVGEPRNTHSNVFTCEYAKNFSGNCMIASTWRRRSNNRRNSAD